MSSALSQLASRPGEKVLVYGIGNLGRQDDGLGIRLVEKLEAAGHSSALTLEANYQLNVEDALLISDFDLVIFADASVEDVVPFAIRTLKPEPHFGFSSHALDMGGVLSLCGELYGRQPRAFVLEIPGYEWDIAEKLSEKAERNLESAFTSLKEALACTKSP